MSNLNVPNYNSVQCTSILDNPVKNLWTSNKTLHINCGEFKYEFISSRGTNSQSLLLDGVDVALIGVQPVALSGSLCSV